MKKVTLLDEKRRVVGEASVHDSVLVLMLAGQAYVRGTGGWHHEFMACETYYLNSVSKIAS